MPGPQNTNPEIETLTRDYGRELFSRLASASVVPLTPAWFDERLMEWTMQDEAVKVQLFRFIDVLPLLKEPAAVNRHLREYFLEARDHLPGWLRWAAPKMPENGFAGRILAATARRNAERLARRFIAGSTVDEALQAIARLRRQSLAFTLDLLGEATVTEEEARLYQNEYLTLLEGLTRPVNSWPGIPQIDNDQRGPLPRVNVSVKLSSLYSQFDPMDGDRTSAAVRARLRPILLLARQRRAFVNFDMEQYAFKDDTLRIFREVLEEDEFRDWSDVGIAIQAYLRETLGDLRELKTWAEARGTPVWVRLVKGAYWDYETVMAAQLDWPVPVFTRKWETDAHYEECSRFLLENHRVLRPAFGSHNVRSLAHAMAAARVLGVPDNGFEFQMLYGMAEPLHRAVVKQGYRVRIYTPVGQLLPGMAYLVRRLLENTANESFLRASVTDHVPEELLLMNPAAKGKTNGAGSRAGGADGPPTHQGVYTPRSPADFANEPITDFSKAEAQRAMREALDRVASEFGREYPVVIAGRKFKTERILNSVNPSHSRQIVGVCASATSELATQAVEAAKAAFPGWRDTPAAERARYLFEAAKVMRRRRFELAAWQVHECGKQWREADADVAEAIDFCDFYAHEMLRLDQPRLRDVPGESNSYFYEPRGVTVVISPWNFPLAILTGMVAAAVVTGNTVVFKPAEQSTVVGAKLMEVFEEVRLPAGVANFLPGVGEEIGPTLTDHRDVAMIAFTGSRGVGLHLNRQAAETPAGQDHIKRVLAELGGKNAIIVDDDADLDEAVRGVVASAFGYQGQKCSACSRAIVLQPIYDQFLSRLVEATRSIQVLPAEDPGSFVGPVIDEEAHQRILNYIEKGKTEARLAYAGEVGELAGEGYYVAPHVFAEVSPTAVIAREEIFGPVLAVLAARDLNQALEIANGTSYALTGGLFSRSPRNVERVRREFRVGNLYINRKITGALVDRQPFGGFKLSGIGSKAGGPDYLLQFVQPRVITENTLRRGFAPEAATAGAAEL